MLQIQSTIIYENKEWGGVDFVKCASEFMKPTDNHDVCLCYKSNLKGNGGTQVLEGREMKFI